MSTVATDDPSRSTDRPDTPFMITKSRSTLASVTWNAAFDSGAAVGALAVGWITAGGAGLPATYLCCAVLVLLTVKLAVQGARRSTGELSAGGGFGGRGFRAHGRAGANPQRRRQHDFPARAGGSVDAVE